MIAGGGSGTVELFSTCPPSNGAPRDEYLQRITDAARWSDEAGYQGMLVYTDNSLVDPWLVSHLILQVTKALCPLVAVQPLYMHPYAAAKMVSSLAFIHGRRVCLNMVAGGFRNDLVALGDDTPHNERYARLVEFTLIVKALLAGSEPVTFHGTYYRVRNLTLIPGIPEELVPGLLMSGSSDEGLDGARATGATAIKYPKPPGEEVDQSGDTVASGIRVGVIARASADEAWRTALERFPEDRRGQITHGLAMKVSDSRWHQQLTALGDEPVSDTNPYWLGPFQNYKTFCPYLVGSYERVGRQLARYRELGFTTFILDVPVSREEFDHTAAAFASSTADLARV